MGEKSVCASVADTLATTGDHGNLALEIWDFIEREGRAGLIVSASDVLGDLVDDGLHFGRCWDVD